MKKLTALLLSLAVALGSCAGFDIKAYAEENELTFFEYLLEGTGELESEVNVASYMKKNNWDIEDLKLQLKYFYLSEPALFYVDREVGILYNKDYSKVILKFEYDYSAAEAKKMLKAMKKSALKAVAGIDEDMHDAEKALAVHDYLILNCVYDHEEKSYSAYDCLVNGKAVCQGYSLAYLYIMRDILGIDCEIAFSDSQNHSWNYLKIGKYWYHVDVTADDPTFATLDGKKYDARGEVLHENLLLSDSEIYKSSGLHRNWSIMDKPAAGNKRYDDFFWRGSTSAMYKVGGLWYYTEVDKGSPGLNYESGGSTNVYTKICTFNFKNRDIKTVKNISSQWNLYRDAESGEKIDGKAWYIKSYMKLVEIDGYLYFNTSSVVYRLDPKTGKTRSVYTLNKENMQIFSIVPSGSSAIRIVYKKDLSYDNKYLKLKIT
ncbi:MAG: hypothetical protein IJ416_05995 [Ruminiclostridium sp.]|nr:hypothetical protein [Ruminiclostridium sp.]